MVTMRDVAARANVSIATVSFVLNAPSGSRRRPGPGSRRPSRSSTTGATSWPRPGSSRTRILALLHPDLESRANAR
ncbi:LacI family DNA-binding transcriptional regulator [Nonomuraea rubra]|uniref:LacI family DNA-binding transcriptional regulator n=1 Tax=Nonomuraea rubra TaxID=46180 RepID=UPI0031E5BBA7